jgi:hypothetical protein
VGNGGEGFLVAVAVEFDVAGLVVEGVAGDAVGIGFAGEEFVDEEGVRGEGLGGGFQVWWDEIGVFIAEAEDGGGFDADEG